MCSAVGWSVPDVRTASSTTASCGVGRRLSRPPSAIAHPLERRSGGFTVADVAHETLAHRLGARGLEPVCGMVHGDGQWRAPDEPRARAAGERKADILHRRQLRVALATPLEDTRHALARNVEPDVAVDAAQLLQLLADPRLLGDLDRERRRQLGLAWEQRTVDGQLGAHGVQVGDVLHPEHLLRLVPNRRAVLEQEAHPVADPHATAALVLDDAPPDRGTLGTVARAPKQILEPDRVDAHRAASVRPS